jgi:hypothetical protein
MSIHINPQTQEPYVQLSGPGLENIIITPSRGPGIASDEQQVILALNDPNVYEYLESPPFPYVVQHAVEYQTGQAKACAELIEQWRGLLESQSQSQSQSQSPDEKEGERKKGWVKGCPFRNVREVIEWSSDGSDPDGKDKDGGKYPVKDVVIGDILFNEYSFYELPTGSEERKEAREALERLPAGSEEMIWGVGCMCLPRLNLLAAGRFLATSGLT